MDAIAETLNMEVMTDLFFLIVVKQNDEIWLEHWVMTNRDFCIIDTWKQVARCMSRSQSVPCFLMLYFYIFRICKSVWLSTAISNQIVFSGMIWKVKFIAFCFKEIELTLYDEKTSHKTQK